jgi:endonuclease YncB( thermonuclease family)
MTNNKDPYYACDVTNNKDPDYACDIPDDMIDVTVYDVDKVKPFNFLNLKLRCYVSQVYDADTCTLIVPFYGKPFEVKCRLHGIDSAEIRTKNLNEKQYAIYSRDYLRNMILDKVVWVICGKMDKYGRLLGDIYTNKEDMLELKNGVSQHLINKNMAYPYSGKTKKSFEDWYNSTI